MDVLLAAALFARITVLTPRDQMHGQFEAGYKRHLQWHREHRDPWTWHGWTIVSGERFGTFIDGTFGHAAADFDAAVAPAEDAADNTGNVLPFATVATSAFYRARPDLGSAAADALTAPFATLVTIPADARAEAALREAKIEGLCFELASGGRSGSYLLFVPARTLSATLTLALPFENATVESLRYRPDMTYVPQP
jgi:hypothetical protein